MVLIHLKTNKYLTAIYGNKYKEEAKNMKKSTFTKTILACAIPAMFAGANVQAADKGDLAHKPQQIENRNTSLIIKFKSDVRIAGELVKGAQVGKRMSDRMTVALGQKVAHQRPMALEGFHVFELSNQLNKRELKQAMETLSRDPNVESIEENIMLRHMAAPNDPQYINQWHYFEATGGLNVETAWNKATGSGVTVAVLDTGIRNHTDLQGQILPGYDMISNTSTAGDGNGRDSDATDPGDFTGWFQCGIFPTDSSWHGTHVAGTIAAATNNNKGVAGVAYDAKILPVRVLGKCGGSTADIADGVIWASGGSVAGVPANANPAQVINMSLGGGAACGSAMQSAVNTARSNGSVVVVAAGNSSADASGFTPASCNGVITVAATNRNGGAASYTNYGSVIDVAGPGGQQSSANDPNGVLSTLNAGSTNPGADNYEYYQGTSMAAPHVAGVAALMFEADPTLTPDQVETILKTTARSFPATCNQCGSGIVDADAAVDSALGN